MFELSDFYTYCKDNDIDVILYQDAPAAGTTIRDNDSYAIFLDFTKIHTTKYMKGVCAHELGHAATGALHKVSSSFDRVERSEYRARKWLAEQYLTEEAFQDAFACGYTELWQLSEYFDLPEEDIEQAWSYWALQRETDLSCMEV